MNTLHREIASDAYWDFPGVEEQGRLPLSSAFRDFTAGVTILNGEVARTFEALEETGVKVHNFDHGQLLVAEPGSVLKVVEDIRAFPKNGSSRNFRYRHTTPERFDAAAAAMTRDLLHKGAPVATKSMTSTGEVVEVARRTSYLGQSASGLRFIGRLAHQLSSKGEILFSYPVPVGHVKGYKDSLGADQTRVVLAQALTPYRMPRKKPRRIIDLAPLADKLILPSEA